MGRDGRRFAKELHGQELLPPAKQQSCLRFRRLYVCGSYLFKQQAERTGKKEYRDYGASVSGEIWTLSLANGETTEKYTDFTHTADNRYSYKDRKGIKTEYGLVRYDSNHPDLLKYASITVDGLCKAPDRTVTTNYLVESYVPNLGTVTDFTTISVEDEITRLDLDYDTSAITNKNGLSIALFNLLSSQELLNMFLGMKRGRVS